MTFNVLADSFPKISAELFVNAYVYGSTAPPRAAAPTTTNPDADDDHDLPTTTHSRTSTDTPPTGATAAGATP